MILRVGAQMRESWVSERGKITDKSFNGRSRAEHGQFRMRQRGRRKAVDPHRTPSQFRRQTAFAALEHGKVGLAIPQGASRRPLDSDPLPADQS